MKESIIVRLAQNRYVNNLRKKLNMKNGPIRKIILGGGAIILFLKHKGNLWDYTEELNRIKNNNYVYEFKRYDQTFRFYLPYYEVDVIQKEMVNYADFFEADNLELMRRKYIRGNESHILDIGANIGNHTVFFCKVCKAKIVYSFECAPKTIEMFKKNISLNELNEEEVRLYEVALGETEGNARLKNYDYSYIGSTQVEKSQDGNIRMARLDDFRFDRIDFIKIDVEGFEYNVLKGAKETLQKHNPVIFIEIWPDRFDLTNQLLKSYGYQLLEAASEIDFVYGYVPQ